LSSRKQSLKSSISSANIQTTAFQKRVVKLAKEVSQSPAYKAKKSIEKLQKQLKLLQAEAAIYHGKTLSAEQVFPVLKAILGHSDDVELLMLRQEATNKLTSVTDGAPTLLQTDFKLELKAEYLSAFEYLSKLENLKSQLFWSAMQYRVEQYPNAKIDIYFHTLSRIDLNASASLENKQQEKQ
jgi:MSHA biogenesis protein MshJ